MGRPVPAPRRSQLLAALAAVILAGCAVAPRKPAVILPWPQARARLQALHSFELTGRVGVAAGDQGFSAHLDWRQRGTQSTVDLSGFLGIGGVHVVANGAMLEVETSKGKPLTSEEARAELTQKLGFDPPLESLRYWILGVPDPGRPAEEKLDSEQRLDSMRQDGWTIDYSAYTSAGGNWLPERMVLTRGDVRVRVAVDRWAL